MTKCTGMHRGLADAFMADVPFFEGTAAERFSHFVELAKDPARSGCS